MRVAVTVPTYNEALNIEALLRALLALPYDVRVIVADDDSPDGTWRIVEKAAAEDPRVRLLHRRADKGRGRAGRDAFAEALRLGADAVVEMDADFSHDPRHVPELVAALARVDVAIGSRAVPGGADIGRSPLRVAITRLANAYARLVLGLPVRDCNSGFRAFRREVIESVRPEAIESVGPSIVHEVLYKAHLLGFRIGESPIVFRERERGESNLSVRKLLQGYWMVLRLRLRHATGALLLPAASRDEAAS